MLENGPAGGGRESGLVGNLTFLELFPIVVALEIWGERLGGRAICFHCDNMSVVRAINSLFASSPPPPVLVLLRRLVLQCWRLNVWVRAQHVPGEKNDIADALSHFQWDWFWKVAPDAQLRGDRCPDSLWTFV